MPPTRSRGLLLCSITLAYSTFIGTLLFSQSSVDSLRKKVNVETLAGDVLKQTTGIEAKLDAKSEKILSKLEQQQVKIYRRMLRTKDSLQAKDALVEIKGKYLSLKERLSKYSRKLPVTQYIPRLDSFTTALKFLYQNGSIAKVKDALSKATSLQDKFQQADQIKDFIKQRRVQLKATLQNLGLVKQLKRYNKEFYYYTEQIKEYKEIISDPKKRERKALELLSRTKLFQDFMRKNSLFSALFRMPGDPNDPTYIASLSGLQTRAQVNGIIQQQISSGGPNAMQKVQQNMQQAQSQINQLKDKVLKSGSGSSDDVLPDFKPNGQKTKSFFKRLEYGTNVQTQKASNFFPVTSDIGISLGYKLNDNSVIGIGASYKMGWGRGWNNISITNQGLGLRSFIDLKIKGSLWLSGGYEQNYRTSFSDFAQLRNLNGWQESGLLGLSKSIPVKSKFFKKTKLQLLWDFLSYQQIPRTQPVVFRIGYNIK